MNRTKNDLKKFENSFNRQKKENKQLKIRNAELEMVLKELLFEKETKKKSFDKENIKKYSNPLENITNL